MNPKAILKSVLARMGLSLGRYDSRYPMHRMIDATGLEVLADPEFQASCAMLGWTTVLDTPRLANLWMLCRMTDPAGAMAEIGTYRGGGALHLSNCCPQRLIVVCDPFSKENFQNLNTQLDKAFYRGQFVNPSEQEVGELLSGRKAQIIPGYFPDSVEGQSLPKLSFVHLDVDVYQASRRSLEFLLTRDVLCDRALIVLDDYNRKAEGVNQAVAEVMEIVKGTLTFPLFPGQALVIPRTWR